MISSMQRRLKTARGEGGELLRQGNGATAYGFAAASLVGIKLPIPVSVCGVDLFLRPDTTDVAVARQNLDGEFDAAITAARPLRHDFIIDAGGYIGTAAITFAQAFPKATIVTLEPSQENFRLLVKNTRLYKNIVPINCALAATARTTLIFDRGNGKWGFTLMDAPRENFTPNPVHAVQTCTVSELLSRFNVSGIDLLKLDIEGAERELFAHCPNWVACTHVLFAEIHERMFPGCEAAFREATTGRTAVACKGEKILSIA